MGWLNIVLILYGLLDIAMGVLGFARAHSIGSLLGGGIGGLIVLGSVVLTKWKPREARIAALAVALLVAGKFAAGAFSNQLYPSGILFAASVAVVVCLALGHMAGMKAKKEREAAQKS